MGKPAKLESPKQCPHCGITAYNADQLEYLLLLAEADVFKGADPPSKLLPFFGPAVSKRAHRDAKP